MHLKQIETGSDLAKLIIDDPVMVARWMGDFRRFNARHPYSTLLSHSCEVAMRLATPRMRLLGWLHDLHELLTCDWPRRIDIKKPAALRYWQIAEDIAMYDGLGIQLPTDNEQAQVDVVDAAVNSLEYDGWHNTQYTICSPSDQVKAFAKVMTECVAAGGKSPQ